MGIGGPEPTSGEIAAGQFMGRLSHDMRTSVYEAVKAQLSFAADNSNQHRLWALIHDLDYDNLSIVRARIDDGLQRRLIHQERADFLLRLVRVIENYTGRLGKEIGESPVFDYSMLSYTRLVATVAATYRGAVADLGMPVGKSEIYTGLAGWIDHYVQMEQYWRDTRQR
jgi:hypothetical protein